MHLPSPLNSSRDDYGLTSKNMLESGYLTSNRSGQDQIYFFEDTLNIELPPLVLMIYAKDRESNKLLENAKITLKNEAEHIEHYVFWGQAIRTTLNRDQNYKISGKWRNFKLNPLTINRKDLKNSDTLKGVLWLDLPEFILKGMAVKAKTQNPL